MIDTPAEAYWALFVLVLFAVMLVLAIVPVAEWSAKRARERKIARKITRAMRGRHRA